MCIPYPYHHSMTGYVLMCCIVMMGRQIAKIVRRLGTSCGSFPSPKCLISLSKYMVQGFRKTWVLCPDVVSNSAISINQSTYPSQINIDILGTEDFHRIFCAAGLRCCLHFPGEDLYFSWETPMLRTNV